MLSILNFILFFCLYSGIVRSPDNFKIKQKSNIEYSGSDETIYLFPKNSRKWGVISDLTLLDEPLQDYPSIKKNQIKKLSLYTRFKNSIKRFFTRIGNLFRSSKRCHGINIPSNQVERNCTIYFNGRNIDIDFIEFDFDRIFPNMFESTKINKMVKYRIKCMRVKKVIPKFLELPQELRNQIENIRYEHIRLEQFLLDFVDSNTEDKLRIVRCQYKRYMKARDKYNNILITDEICPIIFIEEVLPDFNLDTKIRLALYGGQNHLKYNDLKYNDLKYLRSH